MSITGIISAPFRLVGKVVTGVAAQATGRKK